MSYTYDQKKRAEHGGARKDTFPDAGGPSPDALRAGAAQPAPEQLGRRVDLPAAMRTKMENAFGADLSAVKLYESQAVADVGSQAIARGTDIAFAPGLLDFPALAARPSWDTS